MPTRPSTSWKHVPRAALGHLLELVFPGRCIGCGKPLEEPAVLRNGTDLISSGAVFCPPCREPLVLPETASCERCGGRRSRESSDSSAPSGTSVKKPETRYALPPCITNAKNRESVSRYQRPAGAGLAHPAGAGFGWRPLPPCERCRDSLYQFHRIVALGEYDGALRNLVLRMKTDRSGQLAAATADLLWEEREKRLREIGADLIVPVPMHPFRRFWRGVNGPDWIAVKLGKRLRIPVKFRLVRRTKSTRLQFPLNPRERGANLRDAFSCGSPLKLWSRDFSLSDKRILLVDDILTTGSTCNAITKLLLEAGAASVSVAVLARADGKRNS